MGDNTEHARLGCSNPRWGACPGSVREEEAYPNISSAAAMDGTGSHLLLEMCLVNGVPAAQYDRQTIGAGHNDSPSKMGWHVDTDRVKRVQGCLDYIEERVRGLTKQFGDYCKIKVEAETRVNPGMFYGRDDWWGTCDVFIYAVTNINDVIAYLEVCDYKDGHFWVSEKENTQLRDYLLGKLRMLIDDGYNVAKREAQFSYTIYQPKTKNPRRTEVVSYEGLLEHGEMRAAQAALTDAPDAPLSAGKHCKFCRHEQNCEAKQQSRIEKGNVMETNMIKRVETELQTMPAADLATFLKSKEAINNAFAAVEGEIFKRIEAGEQVPGFFIGEGRAANKWNVDDETLVKKLTSMKVPKDKRYTVPKLISPAQARKLDCLTARQLENLEDLISVVAGDPVLKEGEAVKPPSKEVTAEQMFAVEKKSTYDFM